MPTNQLTTRFMDYQQKSKIFSSSPKSCILGLNMASLFTPISVFHRSGQGFYHVNGANVQGSRMKISLVLCVTILLFGIFFCCWWDGFRMIVSLRLEWEGWETNCFLLILGIEVLPGCPTLKTTEIVQKSFRVPLLGYLLIHWFILMAKDIFETPVGNFRCSGKNLYFT